MLLTQPGGSKLGVICRVYIDSTEAAGNLGRAGETKIWSPAIAENEDLFIPEHPGKPTAASQGHPSFCPRREFFILF